MQHFGEFFRQVEAGFPPKYLYFAFRRTFHLK